VIFFWRINRKSQIVNPMPIYEFACPKCRDFQLPLEAREARPSARLPQMRQQKLSKQVSRFAMSRTLKEPAAKNETGNEPPMPDLDDPRIERAMGNGTRHGASG
jgi:putative FmdB family regulatory protein